MTPGEALAGALWLRPGTPRPHNLRSTRPDWVGRVTRGLPAQRLPATLGSLFSLCGHAHLLCAGLAVSAALGRAETVTDAARAQLALQTLREHLRRIAIDWPRRLAAEPWPEARLNDAARALAQCPAFAREPADAGSWLETEAFGMPLVEWLSAWEQDPAAWLAEWLRQGESAVAGLLRDAQAVAGEKLPAVPAVPALRVDADAVVRAPAAPCAGHETGVWTRRNEFAPQRLNSAPLHFGARLAEVARLALHDGPARCGAAWLDAGALPLAQGEAIAWVEMARGLLMHHVQLNGRGDGARVASCRVIAPTDWNFHPDGAVAQALERMPKRPTAEGNRRIDVLVAAYDPCVPYAFDVTLPREAAHA